jgi:hypothetical protein
MGGPICDSLYIRAAICRTIPLCHAEPQLHFLSFVKPVSLAEPVLMHRRAASFTQADATERISNVLYLAFLIALGRVAHGQQTGGLLDIDRLHQQAFLPIR